MMTAKTTCAYFPVGFTPGRVWSISIVWGKEMISSLTSRSGEYVLDIVLNTTLGGKKWPTRRFTMVRLPLAVGLALSRYEISRALGAGGNGGGLPGEPVPAGARG